MAAQSTPKQMSSPPYTVCNPVRIEHKAELVRWLRDTLHPADNTTLHVHFIDNDTPRDLAGLDTALGFDQPSTSCDVKKLAKDIKSLSLFTDGVLLSWSGRKTNSILHSTFNELSEDGEFTDFKRERSLVVTLGYVPKEEDGATKTSPCTHHQLQLTSSDTNLAQVTWQTLITTSVREGDTRPVVCVLVGGDTESLKTAVTAVSNNIPVIVMKPILRDAVEKNKKMEEKQAVELIDRCMKLLFYRDARSLNKYQVAVVTKKGSEIRGPIVSEANWEIAHMVKGYE